MNASRRLLRWWACSGVVLVLAVTVVSVAERDVCISPNNVFHVRVDLFASV